VAVKVYNIPHHAAERRQARLWEAAAHHSTMNPPLLQPYGIVNDGDMCALVEPLMEHGSLHSACVKQVPCLVS
jgi:hypothetical protein